MANCFLGIDTSNYTSSLALVRDGQVEKNLKLPLTVEKGERGLRQSEAVFAHIKNLPLLFETLGSYTPSAVGVSTKPRDVEGSYMPCFLAGYMAARAIAESFGVKCYAFSHQAGHVMAALYSCGRVDLISKRFLAFHVSGGTTELLLCENMKIKKVGGTLDISAGQLIDRVGVRLGFDFPSGKAMEKISLPLDKVDCASYVRGTECNLSGLENKALERISKGEDAPHVCAFVIKSVLRTIDKLTSNAILEYGELPLLYAGGVMSNTLIKNKIQEKYNAYFASPDYSTDNAAGVALLAYNKFENEHE